MPPVPKAFLVFAAAALAEIAGCFAFWAWLRQGKSILWLAPGVVSLMLFAAWTCVTTAVALDPPSAYVLWDRTIKSIVLALAVVTLANSKGRIQAVTWMVVVSLGYYAVKGGGFTLLTAGQNRVFGPPDSQINDNNTLGLALLMVLPLVNYLRASHVDMNEIEGQEQLRMKDGCLQPGLDPGRGDQEQRLLAASHRGAGQQSWQAVAVVAMDVGDANAGQVVHR